MRFGRLSLALAAVLAFSAGSVALARTTPPVLPAKGTVQAAFTPEDDIEGLLADAIDQARQQVLVQAYLLSNKAITRALLAAHQRGVDVRVLAATNRSAEEAVESGQFRRDLYFRIKVITIELPLLSERTDDIPLLVDLFVGDLSRRHGKNIRGLTHEALNMLRGYSWPGNVRELRNVIENMVVMSQHEMLDVNDLPENVYHAPEQKSLAVPLRAGMGMSLAEAERKLITETLELTDGNREKAARILGIGERTLYRKLKEYELS